MKSKHNMTVANITEPDMDHMPYNAAVVYHKLEFILSNLKHFEEYSIEVRLYILFPRFCPDFFGHLFAEQPEKLVKVIFYESKNFTLSESFQYLFETVLLSTS